MLDDIDRTIPPSSSTSAVTTLTPMLFPSLEQGSQRVVDFSTHKWRHSSEISDYFCGSADLEESGLCRDDYPMEGILQVKCDSF